MQTTVPFILQILIPYKRVACLMNTLNDFTVGQIIYESNTVKKERYDPAPNEIQYACKQHHRSLCYNSGSQKATKSGGEIELIYFSYSFKVD